MCISMLLHQRPQYQLSKRFILGVVQIFGLEFKLSIVMIIYLHVQCTPLTEIQRVRGRVGALARAFLQESCLTFV